MNILLTGCAGYIGSVLTRQLLARGCRVRGLDALLFGGESLVEVATHPGFEFIRGDIRDERTVRDALRGMDGVAHLAAIVGDPACAKQADLARATNGDASRQLLALAQQAGTVQRFVFASTCSNYGKMEGDAFLTENALLKPVSLYAELKVAFERHLLEAAVVPHLAPVSLRFSTVYGPSPRLRFDLTVNEFVRDLVLGRSLQVFGEQFWRPYCHVEDLARSVVAVLEAPIEKVRQEVFNVGDTGQNYTKKMLVEEIFRLYPEIPRSQVTYVRKVEDPRDYRVDFSKIHGSLGYTITKRVPDGIRELAQMLRQGIVSEPDSARYRNI